MGSAEVTASGASRLMCPCCSLQEPGFLLERFRAHWKLLMEQRRGNLAKSAKFPNDSQLSGNKKHIASSEGRGRTNNY